MLSRPPLSSSHRSNIPEKTTDTGKDVEHKLKKALVGLAEERRKRAEVEVVVEGLKRDKNDVAIILEEMQTKLAQAQAEIKAQKSTIIRLNSASATSSAISSTYTNLESKLQDLVVKHNQSQSKHASELADITSSNITLQSRISNLQSASSIDKQAITDLRSERALLKKEVEVLKARPVTAKDEKVDEMSRFKAERRIWREERIALESQVRELKRGLEDVEGRGLDEKVREMEEKIMGMEGLLRDAALAYGQLYANTVNEELYEETRDKLELERTERRAYERKCRAARHDVQSLRKENKEMQIRLEDMTKEGNTLTNDLEEIIAQRALDRPLPILSRDDYSTPNPITPSSDILSLLDLALTHLSLLTSHTSYKSAISHESITSLSSDLSHAVSSLSTARTSLSALQITHESTSTRLEEMLKNHTDCHDQILNHRGEANRAIAARDRLKSELCDVRVELERVEERAKGDREALRRANEGSARWGAARVALEDEVDSLRSALEVFTDLQERCDSLFEETEILRDREAMALDEADRLGLQNSELIGHGNGSQKISYVEGLRREMALVKHELATTRHHLNSALSQISALTSEIESYKSISPSLLASTTGAGRVRVSRRAPEGGEVLGASIARRSVSVSTSASTMGRH